MWLHLASPQDNKPSVVSLQRLIVREMALEGRGMFLICATSSMPEMYEIYAGSKQECETWMTLIRGAVDRWVGGGRQGGRG